MKEKDVINIDGKRFEVRKIVGDVAIVVNLDSDNLEVSRIKIF